MSMTDPIADLLTRIRNALQAGHRIVEIPHSRIKESIVKILTEESYVRDFRVIEDEVQGTIKILLKYNQDGSPAINGLKRISKPGLRQYANTSNLPRVYNNLGIAILTTPVGVITNKKARAERVGGEVLCHVW